MQQMLRVEVKKVSGLVKDRVYTVSVEIGDEVVETEPKKGCGTIEWHQLPWTMPATEKSKIVLRLFARRKLDAFGLATPKCLGECEVYPSGANETAIVRLESRVPEGSGVEITLTISQNTEDSRRNDLKDATEQAVGAAQAVLPAENPVPILLDRVKSFIELVDKIVEVHPYAKLAWQVIKAQAERDQRVQALISKMNDVYEFIGKARELRAHEGLLGRLSQQTIECCMFIQKYTADATFVKRAVKHLLTTADDAIDEYMGKFDEIMEKYRNHSSVHIELATLSIARSLSDLGDEVNLHDMPYAKGARFESGKQCYPGTRVKILDDIANWALNSRDGSRLCLLAGPAGIGKSAIAHSIAKRFDKMQRLGSSFCFDRSDVANRRPDMLFPTIARDLADYDPSFKQTLGAIIRNHTSLRNTRDIDDQFDNLITQPASSFSVPGPVIVVIDALDESGQAGKLLSVLLRRMKSLPPDLKLFITARDEGTIVQRALASHLTFRPGDSSDLQGKSASNDVLLFVNSQLLDGDEGPIPGIDESHCKSLVEQSEGLFQWAAVACAVIAGVGSRIGTTPMERYRDVISAGSTLDGLYTRILSRLIDFDDPRSVKRFKALIGIALTTFEPLNMNTLRVLWRHSEENSEDPDGQFNSVLKYMGSLLSGVTDETAPVRPLHTTFREYLTDPKRSGKLYVNAEASHSQLAAGSLSVMVSQLCFNICRLETSYLRNRDIKDLGERVEKHIGAHLSYICRFWHGHLAKSCSFGSKIELRVVDVLMNKALYWFEVLSLVGGINLVHHLQANLSVMIESSNLQEDMIEMILDLERFARIFGAAITESASHIYLSALPFSPSLSTISKYYEPHFTNVPAIAKGRAEEWPLIEETFLAHTKAIRSLTFSPDGTYIASGSIDDSIKLWDPETKSLVQTLHSAHGGILALAFSSDGKLLASGSDGGIVQLWDLSAEEPHSVLDLKHGEPVSSVGFSPDGELLVSGSRQNSLMLWSTKTGQALSDQFVQHAEDIRSISFAPDGSSFASGSNDGRILIWSLSSNQIIRELKPKYDEGAITHLTYSDNGSQIFSVSDTGLVRIWDATTGKRVAKLLGEETYTVLSSTFSPTCDRVVTCSHSGIIDIWALPPIAESNSRKDKTKTKPSAHITGRPTNDICSVALSPDTTQLILGAWNGMIHVWHLDRDADSWPSLPEEEDEPIEGDVEEVIFSPDGKYIASLNVAEDFTFAVRIFDSRTGEMVRGPLRCSDGSSDDEGEEEEREKGEKGAVQCSALRFSRDGDKLAALAFSCVHIWSVANGEDESEDENEEEFIWEDHTASCVTLAFSPVDNDQIALGWDDGGVKIWDIEGDRAVSICSAPLHPTDQPKLVINRLLFSPDGKQLFVGGCLRGTLTGVVRIHQPESGEHIRTITFPDSDMITSMALSLDGRQIITSYAASGTIDFTNIETGERVKQLTDEEEFRTTGLVCISNQTSEVREVDGRREWDKEDIIASGGRGMIKRWNLSEGKAVRKIYQGRSVSWISLSPNQKRLVSAMADGGIRVWGTAGPQFGDKARAFSSKPEHAPSMGSESVLEFDVKTGWVEGPNGELVLWVPPAHRVGLWLPGMTALCGKQSTEVDMSAYDHGSDWAKCFRGEVNKKED